MARNPDKVREYRRPGQRAYKARKRAAFTLPFSRDQLGARIAYYGWRCWLCGSTWQQVDHVKPLARGGSHILANLRPICSRCNQSKKAAWPMASVMARFVEKESG
jgi:5-methylcytosine-specific restriction endonuclease McrA